MEKTNCHSGRELAHLPSMHETWLQSLIPHLLIQKRETDGKNHTMCSQDRTHETISRKRMDKQSFSCTLHFSFYTHQLHVCPPVLIT